MKKIGITGGIGSGKTTVCKIFELLGVPVFYADDEAKKLLDTDADVKQNIIESFGKNLLNDSNRIDRKKLADLVFNDKEKLQKLNSIVHPAVGKNFEKWAQNHSSHKYIVEEVAILFESGADKRIDKIITVVAPKELKIKRVLQRDQVTSGQVEQRIQNQLSDDEKIKRSNYIIMNDELQLVIPQVINIHQQLTEY